MYLEADNAEVSIMQQLRCPGRPSVHDAAITRVSIWLVVPNACHTLRDSAFSLATRSVGSDVH